MRYRPCVAHCRALRVRDVSTTLDLVVRLFSKSRNNLYFCRKEFFDKKETDHRSISEIYKTIGEQITNPDILHAPLLCPHI